VGYAVAWLRQAGHRRAILARFENVFSRLTGVKARGNAAQDRGDMKGRCEPRENIERRASKKFRGVFERRLGPGVLVGARHVSISRGWGSAVHRATRSGKSDGRA
jgi:hypothetical protein